MDKTNNVEILCPANPDGGEIVWQPVMMVPVNSRLDRPLNYPGMKVIAVRIFSAICIILGIASIGVQVNNRLIGQRVRIKFFQISFQDSGAGDLLHFIIQLRRVANGRRGTRDLGWCIILDCWQFGNSGLSQTNPITVKKKIIIIIVFLKPDFYSLINVQIKTNQDCNFYSMLGTMVLALLSICASVVASTLSGMAAAHGIYKSCYHYSSSLSSLCKAVIQIFWLKK
jgi:hypothetical protein